MSTFTYLMVIAIAYCFWKAISGKRKIEAPKEEEPMEEESTEDDNTCSHCRNKFKGDYNVCDECNNEMLCDDCVVIFENYGYVICKKCVDKEYPRKEKVVVKEIEKEYTLSEEDKKRLDKPLDEHEFD